jgi:hypothetical protein
MFRYICSAQKKLVKYDLKISKKGLLRLAALIVVVGATVILDIYFDKHPVGLEEIEADSGQADKSENMICLYNPFSSLSAKISIQKIPSRILYEQSHNKLIQKYHQQHDSQILKTDYKKTVNPSLLSFLQLIAGHYYFSFSEEDHPVLL